MEVRVNLLTRCAVIVAVGLFHAAQAADTRMVSVSGQGEVQAEPDRATLTLGAESRKAKLNEARDEVARTVDAVLKLTRDLKIDAKYVRTTRLNIQPQYNWNAQNSSRMLIGYLVSRQVEVDLRELDKLGTLLERAADAGVNQISDPQLDSSRRRDFEREALSKAVVDARLNAETLAKAAGATLGAVRNLSASTESTPPIVMPRVMAMKSAAETTDASSTYQSGQLNFNVTVRADYDLIAAP